MTAALPYRKKMMRAIPIRTMPTSNTSRVRHFGPNHAAMSFSVSGFTVLDLLFRG